MYSIKPQSKSNGTGGYLDHLFDDKPKESQPAPEPLIDSTRLRKDLSSSVYTKAEENKKKKFPYVYGPKLPQLEPRHLYSVSSDNESVNLTLVEHPNQPTIPKSIPKRDKRQTKDSTKIKGKLSALNEKQDTLINRTTTYNQIYPKDSEKKISKDINPITKPVYKLWGKFKNDKDLKNGKKVQYAASVPKTPIWQRFTSKENAKDSSNDADIQENLSGLGDIDPDTHNNELNKTRTNEGVDADIQENIKGVVGGVDTEAIDGGVDTEAIDGAEGAVEVPSKSDDVIAENLVDNAKKDTSAVIDTEALEDADGAVELQSENVIDNDAIEAADGAVEVENFVPNDVEVDESLVKQISNTIDTDALEAADGAVENDEADDAVENDEADDVKSKISYNPIFFINKKSNKKIQKSFESPLQAVSSKFKNLVSYKDKKSLTNSDNIKEVGELQQKQDSNTEKIAILTDEIIELQEQCQPLHFKKLDELERQNQLKKFHHKVDLYKHEQAKLQIEKKKIEKERRHKGREYNREMRSNIRKQRQLQKTKRDLKKEQLRSLRRHQRKVNHFNEMKKKFVTDVESETFEAPEFADDESEEFIQPVESVVSTKQEKAELAEGEDDVEEQKFTKEFIEPDTPEQYEEKINGIGKEFDFISNEPLITHEEEKELTNLKREINAKKEEINKISENLNSNNEIINSKLAVISDFKPPVETKSNSILSNIKTPLLSTNFKTINKDFTVLTDDEFVLSDPSEISATPEYVEGKSSDESHLSTEKISSSDIGEETDSEDEGTAIDQVPAGYKGVLPQRGFLRSVNHDSGNAKHLAFAKVPDVYDSWVIKEGTEGDHVAKGFKGVLPQNKYLDSVNFDKSSGAHLKNAKVPKIYDTWAQKDDNLKSIKSNAFTEYTEEDIVTVPSGYKLNEKVL
ncbi:hypothetical protein FOG50_00007 [Hanseniaspora uvarum]|nr:hypothetical protein FOG50_00007 [Hanseniaspora uvarum]